MPVQPPPSHFLQHPLLGGQSPVEGQGGAVRAPRVSCSLRSRFTGAPIVSWQGSMGGRPPACPHPGSYRPPGCPWGEVRRAGPPALENTKGWGGREPHALEDGAPSCPESCRLGPWAAGRSRYGARAVWRATQLRVPSVLPGRLSAFNTARRETRGRGQKKEKTNSKNFYIKRPPAELSASQLGGHSPLVTGWQ